MVTKEEILHNMKKQYTPKEKNIIKLKNYLKKCKK